VLLFLEKTVYKKLLISKICKTLCAFSHATYPRHVQAAFTATLGWLYHSTQSIDVNSLCEAVSEQKGCHIGLHWKAIVLSAEKMFTKADCYNPQALQVKVAFAVWQRHG
jgi:hypothetical protein